MPGVSPSLLSLLYLASPALPVGAFSWSQGLAPACAEGLVSDENSLRRWLLSLLLFGLERLDIPVFFRCYRAAGKNDARSFFHWNAMLLAGRESAELWREEEQTGKALCRLLRELELLPCWMRERTCGYVAAFALAAVRLGLDPDREEEAACAYVWSWLENQTAAACKCLALGQSAARRVLLHIMPEITRSVARAAQTADEDVGASLPGLALASSRHETQYSRLFRS
jgi:urease accessory protein